MKHLFSLNKFFFRYRWRFLGGILFVLLSNYFGILSPQITGYIILYVQRGAAVAAQSTAGYDVFVQWITIKIGSIFSAGNVVAMCGILILVLALLRGVFMFLMRQTIIVMSRHIEYDQKNEVYEQYQRLDASFYKVNSTGDLMNRIAEDVSRVRMYTGPALMYVINLVAMISLAVYFMVRRDAMLTLYVLLPLPILAVTIYLVNNLINKRSEAIQQQLSSLTSVAQETYSGIRVIKSFVQETAMQGFFAAHSENYRKDALALARVEAIYFPSMTFLIGLSTVFTILIGGYEYVQHPSADGLSKLVEFVMYINMLMFPVSAIGLTASMIQRAAASQKRLNEFLTITPTIKDSFVKDERIMSEAFPLLFRDVDFTYEHTGIQALKDVSFTIQKGEKVAIVGRTGSGKSTLAQLILRNFEPDKGTILLNELEIQKYSLSKLRKHIRYVPQDVFLFSDTVHNNISFGKPGATRMEVEEAAKQAAIYTEILEFGEGFETMVGERGVTLSGGQKQRISIARALIGTGELIIFDDCLSAVDAKTESTILNNLSEVFAGKTAIIITHRIFSLLRFDKILVMENGSIIEMGTHDELLAINGIYTQLYKEQQEAEGVVNQ